MRYCSLDIETTGLNPKTCDIVQFAAVLDDLNNPQPLEKLPKLNVYFTQPTYQGEPYALGMHPGIWNKIATAQQKKIEYDGESDSHFTSIQELPYILQNFLSGNGVEEKYGKYKITPAGKNAAMFDLPFLKEKINDFGNVVFLHRVLDPAVMYFDYKIDKTLPDSKLCMERAGIAGEVAHTALEDALTVVKLIRYKLLGKI